MTTSNTGISMQDYQTPFTYHDDASHAWLEVPYQLLVTLKIQHEITGYSYRKGTQVYLEEDLDMGTFLKAYFSYLGITLNQQTIREFWDRKTVSTYSDYSPIRNYRSFYVS